MQGRANNPRKHHYLPKFYLRHFSDAREQLYQVEKERAAGYISAIEDSAAIRDFHTLDYTGCPDPFAMEKRLADIESDLSRVLARVLEAGAIPEEVHGDLVYFVALMRTRVPAFKNHVEHSLKQLVRATGEILERNGKLPPPPEGLEDQLRVAHLEIQILNWKLVQTMFEVAGDPEALRVLGSMNATILRVPKGMTLLTSDQPVALFNKEARPTDAIGYGPAHRSSEITLPLSSEMLLRLSWEEGRSTSRHLRESDVAEINRRTIVMANSRVFAAKKAGWVDKMVARHRHCSAGFELDTQPQGGGELHFARTKPVMLAVHYSTGR